MRTELEQMDRMAVDERFGDQAGEIARRQEAIRRRIRRGQQEKEESEEWPLDAGCT